MTTAIHTVYWDFLKPEGVTGDWATEPDIMAIWPAPVNADACFLAAGFDEFADSDKQWDDEWAGMIGRLLAHLESKGKICECHSADVYAMMPLPQRLVKFLRGRPTRRRVQLSIAEQIAVVTADDQFGEVSVTFGSGPAARLKAGSGHEVGRACNLAKRVAREMAEKP